MASMWPVANRVAAKSNRLLSGSCKMQMSPTQQVHEWFYRDIQVFRDLFNMSPLQDRIAKQLHIRQAESRLRKLHSSPTTSVDLSSNDFLSLATDPRFRQDLLAEIEQQALAVGSTGSRLLDGNSQYAEDLERTIASFHGAQSGLLTNSGYDANVSIFMCLPQTEDVIVYDELIHASVHDGMRQSRATERTTFKHNCMQSLRALLLQYISIPPSRQVFIAVESVYSMDGDLAPLQEIATMMTELFPLGNCHLVVDEAHATGVYGTQGRGRVSELGLDERVLIRLHTFGKALACNGAIILCPDIVKQYLLNYARPLIYTTFMSYPSLCSIKVAYDWLQSGRIDQLANHLFRLISYFHHRLQMLQPLLRRVPPGSFEMPTEYPQSSIIAILTKQPRLLAAHCQAAGFIVRAVVPPTVPPGTERVRVCLHAGNTSKQIDDFVLCLELWLSQYLPAASGGSKDWIVHDASAANTLHAQRLIGYESHEASGKLAAKL